MMFDNLFAFTPQNIAMYLVAVAAGAFLSMIYFGGLWFTVQRLDRANTPVLLFSGSFLVRIVVVLAGFYLVSGGRIDRLVICFISFLITRHFVLRWAQPSQREENK